MIPLIFLFVAVQAYTGRVERRGAEFGLLGASFVAERGPAGTADRRLRYVGMQCELAKGCRIRLAGNPDVAIGSYRPGRCQRRSDRAAGTSPRNERQRPKAASTRYPPLGSQEVDPTSPDNPSKPTPLRPVTIPPTHQQPHPAQKPDVPKRREHASGPGYKHKLLVCGDVAPYQRLVLADD
jgi:hypothetical protein